MATITQQTHLKVNVSQYANGNYPTFSPAQAFDYAVYRAFRLGVLWDTIFHRDLGGRYLDVRVSSVEEKDKPDDPNFIWYTIKFSDDSELYFSPNSMEEYEAAMLWEQRQPNESM